MPPRTRSRGQAGASSDDPDFLPTDASASDSGGDSSGDEGAVYVAGPSGEMTRREAGAGGRRARRAAPPRPPRVAQTPLAAAVAAACSPRFAPSELAAGPATPSPAPSRLLRAREAGRRFSAAQRAHLAARPFAPAAPAALIDRRHSRAYVGTFSKSGALFVAGYQGDRLLRVFDSSAATAPRWRLLKQARCRLLRWTVTEVAVADDDGALAYSSISPTVHVVPLARGGGAAVVDSVANLTEIHEPIDLDRVAGTHPDFRLDPFGVWSLAWAPGGAPAPRLLAGTGGGGGDGHAVIADVTIGRTIHRVPAGEDDVNAVAWLDDGGTTFAAAGDDARVRIFDARTLRAGDDATARPAIELEGHLAGVTFLDARRDGAHLLSNGKDQTARLWDIRAPTGGRPRAAAAARPAPVVDFDYRWQAWPRAAAGLTHPRDGSLATYAGHSVLQTLIRARFSPAAAGGAHVYAGSADGAVRVWSLCGGRDPERVLHHHADVVRDCCWHPTEPGVLATASFDGTAVRWGPRGEAAGGGVDEADGRGPAGRRSSIESPGSDVDGQGWEAQEFWEYGD